VIVVRKIVGEEKKEKIKGELR